MGFDAWITLGALAVMVAALVTGRLSPPAAVIGTSAALFVLGVTAVSYTHLTLPTIYSV